MKTKKSIISKKAKELGFDLIGFTKKSIKNIHKVNLKKFLEKNHHGEMKWLEKHYEKKIEPEKLWNEVRTIVVLGLNYGPQENPIIDNEKKEKANISVYAKNKDYHLVIEEKLRELKKWISDYYKIDSKFFVDKYPVFEKPIAQMAGLGWIGKHTNLVSKKIGSWFFLSEIFLPIDIDLDSEESDHCGSCNSCLDICPTQAFDKAYKIDARKCISYLTIESKGPIPLSLREKIGNKVYGCDDCLSICPWNKFSKPTKQKDFKEIHGSNNSLIFFLNFNEDKFEKYFKNSAIKRIGWIRFLRNIIIATGNSENRYFIEYLKKYLKHEEPLIRGTSVWAFGQICKNNKEKENIKKTYLPYEKNEYVNFEWSIF